jgi:NADH:ubiquinone oxidoreductase subunit E
MNTTKFKMQLLVCGGTGCKASQSEEIVANLNAELEAHGIENEAKVVTTGCFGFCEQGPIVKVIPDNTFYTQVKPSDAK